ncbi:hypothetical protein [Pseudomonas fluorescens]|uniref:hypothetical protein n=1 Tax=Pseudomonas fluorescens TaxID=294 RepID=UPI001A9D6780|nr:hypothetical protein [Pseudomonas fluorescens]QTD31459.1 hypothetical protein JZM58_19410 [Pseudomonas fluorescens]
MIKDKLLPLYFGEKLLEQGYVWSWLKGRPLNALVLPWEGMEVGDMIVPYVSCSTWGVGASAVEVTAINVKRLVRVVFPAHTLESILTEERGGLYFSYTVESRQGLIESPAVRLEVKCKFGLSHCGVGSR